MTTMVDMITSLCRFEKMTTAAIVCFIFLISLSPILIRIIGHPRDWFLTAVFSIWFPSLGHVFDKLADNVVRCNGTFVVKGSWFSGPDVIFTSNPSNLHHIMSTNFWNYPKGSLMSSIFDVYGQMLFTVDHDEWKLHRKVTNSYFYDHRLLQYSQIVNREIIEEGIFPFLDDSSEKGLVFDLQDVFQRAMLDSTSMTATRKNHGSLQVGLPHDSVLDAINVANYQIFMRHILPEKMWKLQRWLGIGGEKKMKEAWETLDNVCVKDVNIRRNEISSGISSSQDMDIIKASEEDVIRNLINVSDNLLRDTVKGLLFAGTDTTGTVLSWFFWLMSKNPRVEKRIREELEAHNGKNINNCKKNLHTNPEELNKLIYLKAAIYETLRLYPAVPFQSRTSTRSDVLPSGHHVGPKTRIVLAYYAIGRMKSIWGEDCGEFKPERWLSDKGGLVPVQSNKFLAFGSGPRICPGKELGMNRAQAVAAAIIPKYKFKVINNKRVMPAACATLYLKDGLMVRVSKISA